MKHPQAAPPGDDGPHTAGRLDPLEQQAHAWVRRLAAGGARRADARALEQWCAISHAHRGAFATAHRKWTALRAAAELAGEGDAELAALRSGRARGAPPVMQRRFFMGGAVAASAAAAGVLLLNPPMALWPSLQSLQADYKTRTGEQRRLALADHVTVDLNTRSSVNLRTDAGRMLGMELIEGEVAVDVARASAAQAFTVFAGGGRVRATDAVFEVRQLASTISLTCCAGLVDVLLGERQLQLASGQQLTYTRGTLHTVSRADNVALSAWREGILSFQQTALAQVVDEINRYRPGRVILIGDALAGKPVSGRFNIRDLDKAIVQIQRLFRLEATSLPGGVVVLS